MSCVSNVLSKLVRPDSKLLSRDGAVELSAYLERECGLFYVEADRLVFEANQSVAETKGGFHGKALKKTYQ